MWSRVDQPGAPETPAPPRVRPWTSLRRTVEAVLVLAAVLYVTALVASRTKGFRGIVEARLSERLGGTTRVGASALTLRLDLRLDRVTWGAPDRPGAAAIRADRVVLRPAWPWRPGRLRGAEARGVRVAFAQTAEGAWQPTTLAPLGAAIESWTGVGFLSPPPPPAPAPSAAPAAPSAPAAGPQYLRVRNAELVWWNAAGERIARIEELDLDVTAIDLPGRIVRHVRAAAGRFERERGASAGRVRIEFLDTGRERVLLEFDTGG